MATVKLRRGDEWVGKIRAYQVVLDGSTVGSVRRDQEGAFTVPAGNHELRVKMDWCSSKPVKFSVADNETANFECGSNAGPLSALYYFILRPGDAFWVRRVALPGTLPGSSR